MIVSHLLLILHKKIQFYIFMFEAWNVAKFKGAEYFLKALYISRKGNAQVIYNALSMFSVFPEQGQYYWFGWGSLKIMNVGLFQAFYRASVEWLCTSLVLTCYNKNQPCITSRDNADDDAGSRVARWSKTPLSVQKASVTAVPGSNPGCIISGRDWESHSAAHMSL